MRKGVKVIVISGLLLAALGGPALFADYVEDGAPVCVYSGEQEYPVICVDENANAFIAWEDRRGYPDIYAQMINDKGARLWAEAGVAICTATYGQYGPRTCSDGAGGAIIAWTDARASNVRDIYAQRIGPDGNISWTANGVPVCTEAGHQYLYDICADGRGGAILVWQDERVSSSWDDIYCQRINENGIVLWNATGVPLSTGISFLREKPQVVPDGKGGGIFTWIDWGSGGIFGQRVNAAGTIMWDANGSAICDASGNQYEPKIVPDGLGGALITWYDHR
ncbi:MAG: hypothetical protein JXB45_03075, partial [Candidatus Krumholzibacteriota bacterium]|nr:hypothetical protein [Candidatus Krumholzibacteriota bacterium]